MCVVVVEWKEPCTKNVIIFVVIFICEIVTVVNGDRSSLTWKRYRLQSIDPNSGMCTVVGVDGKTRQFPRAVVKPKVNIFFVFFQRPKYR